MNNNMKKNKMKWRVTGCLLLSLMLLPGCSDMDEYFDNTGGADASIYEKLEASGNYRQFLEGVDRLGMKPMLNGKSILTVMAPADDAMTNYLREHYGAASVGELSDDELKKLIGFHIIYYSFKKDDFINFHPNLADGASEEDMQLNAGLYYKFRTKSQDAPSAENDSVTVYHFERYLPVFSYMLFRTKGISAADNYNYFYPATGWRDDAGFNVANASVAEYPSRDNGGIASNGYIYKVDRVLRPLETIYQEMRQAGKYEKFLKFYDTFRVYQKEDELTREYGNGQDLYTIVFSDGGRALPPIASEWPVNDYTQVVPLSYRAYSIFAPTDEALDNFFDDYWKLGGYESLDSVSPTLVSTLLRHSIYSESIVFPEEIEKGTILDDSDNPIIFDTEEVPQADRVICSNGVLYGCSVLTPPAMFNSVTGPAYQYKKFSNFQLMLANSGQQNALSAQGASYIMLYPDNDQLLEFRGIKLKDGKLVEGPRETNLGNGNSYVNMHAAPILDGNTTLPTGQGLRVIRTMHADQNMYWYVKNGRITTCIEHNRLLRYAGNETTEDDIYAEFEPLGYRGNPDGWTNGHVYTYKNKLFEGDFANAELQSFTSTMITMRSDKTADFYGWITLMDKAGLVDYNALALTFISESSLKFVPTTDALQRAIIAGRIPGVAGTGEVGSDDFFDHVTITDAKSFSDYATLYFVPLSTAVMSEYPYVGWGENTETNGGLQTLPINEVDEGGFINPVSSYLNVYDNANKLTVGVSGSGKAVDVIPDFDYLPFVFTDGPVHFIGDVF